MASRQISFELKSIFVIEKSESQLFFVWLKFKYQIKYIQGVSNASEFPRENKKTTHTVKFILRPTYFFLEYRNDVINDIFPWTFTFENYQKYSLLCPFESHAKFSKKKSKIALALNSKLQLFWRFGCHFKCHTFL